MTKKIQPKKIQRDLSVADPEDRKTLRGKSPGYIRGWNKVKYKHHSNG